MHFITRTLIKFPVSVPWLVQTRFFIFIVFYHLLFTDLYSSHFWGCQMIVLKLILFGSVSLTLLSLSERFDCFLLRHFYCWTFIFYSDWNVKIKARRTTMDQFMIIKTTYLWKSETQKKDRSIVIKTTVSWKVGRRDQFLAQWCSFGIDDQLENKKN